jgi:glutathione S-transferase
MTGKNMPAQTNHQPVTMYGAPPSLYSGKVRSYLRKQGIPFEERLTCHPDFFEKIVPAVGRYVIPVVQAQNGDIIQDTSEIIDHFETQQRTASAYPNTPKQKIVALILELFGDEGLIRPAMHYRWSFAEENDAFISYEFGRFMSPQAANEEAYQLAAMPKSQMNAYLPPLGISEETTGIIEEAYLEFLLTLDRHLLKYPYMLGGRPTIADYGLYAPLYAHLARDPAPAMIMKKHGNRVHRWVERMTVADADMPEFPDMPQSTLPDDKIPGTLKDILQLVSRDYLPELIGLTSFINEHIANNNPEENTPVVDGTSKRTLGFFTCNVRGKDVSLTARHYSLWMLQRVQDAFDSLSVTDQSEVKTLLEEVSLDGLINLRTLRRIERRDFKEVWGTERV